MKDLLIKELKLATQPITYCFLAFSLMTLLPGYPILLGAFFVCLGIFQSFQSGRENNDILYTVLLPVRKSDAVKAKFLSVCFIELAAFLAMKAYALGRRSKWKDYVDLYFLLTKCFSLAEVSAKATELFGELFSEKLFRAQLSYFDDIDYTEQVEYLIPNPPTAEEIKRVLTELSLKDV